MRVLVLDLTHGGGLLARAYAGRGDEVTAVDVYGTSPIKLKASLVAAGVRVLGSSTAESFDLGVAPIHCPDSFYGEAKCARRITHHQAVGELVSFPFPVVEVTGAHGKTSTCQLIARMLADQGRKVLLLTSGGLSVVDAGGIRMLRERISIAPPTVLDIAQERHDADVGVFEVSLGGTGANVSVITTIGDDYAIAGGTRRAFDGKVQMFRSARGAAIFPEDERQLWAPHAPPGRSITFGPGGDVQVDIEGLSLGRPARMRLKVGDETAVGELQSSYLVPAYRTAFGAAAAAAWSLGASAESIARTLSSFEGAKGRGEVSTEGERVLVRDRNPGVSATSIRWNLQCLYDYGCSDIGVAIEPISRKVCEKLDLAAVRSVVDEHPAVTGLYMMPPGGEREGFEPVDAIDQVRKQHAVTLWCTKEGYL